MYLVCQALATSLIPWQVSFNRQSSQLSEDIQISMLLTVNLFRDLTHSIILSLFINYLSTIITSFKLGIQVAITLCSFVN